MIDYLEQLERDLVEAIDERASRRRSRLVRRRLVPLVGIAVAVLVAVALGVPRLADDREVATPPTPTAAPTATPVPLGRSLRLAGTLARVGVRRWEGEATGPGGPATLTITGTVDLSRNRCCGSPERAGSWTRHTIRFNWTTPTGSVAGCIDNRIYRRPHGRWVWDGLGSVTTATGGLSRYRAYGASIAGRTPTSSPDSVRIIIGAAADPAPVGC
jgi:hypothetical protein